MRAAQRSDFGPNEQCCPAVYAKPIRFIDTVIIDPPHLYDYSLFLHPHATSSENSLEEEIPDSIEPPEAERSFVDVNDEQAQEEKIKVDVKVEEGSDAEESVEVEPEAETELAGDNVGDVKEVSEPVQEDAPETEEKEETDPEPFIPQPVFGGQFAHPENPADQIPEKAKSSFMHNFNQTIYSPFSKLVRSDYIEDMRCPDGEILDIIKSILAETKTNADGTPFEPSTETIAHAYEVLFPNPTKAEKRIKLMKVQITSLHRAYLEYTGFISSSLGEGVRYVTGIEMKTKGEIHSIFSVSDHYPRAIRFFCVDQLMIEEIDGIDWSEFALN